MNVATNFKWIEAANYDELSKIAATIFIDQLKKDSSTVFGMATGGTPEGFYKKLVAAYKAGEISFKQAKSFNLDEYIGINPANEASYHYYMDYNLFNHIDMKRENIYLPAGNKSNLEKAAAEYDALINAAGNIDIQLLGIGVNGHIGFNEPGTPFDLGTNIVELAQSTREANQVYFDSIDDVPTHAITMGIKTILNSKKIVLLISGASKQEAFERLRSGVVTEDFPASALHNHPYVTVIYTDVK
ncbi:6-phosphogluconolactonase/Glucosamine-6-phosphate isomerase/deaminase [Solibacillus silvestris StLB046]|uniref:Glucosamine-6-phosphate deaminase n=1 Tax=Solibacillus silvestris (strain StLB046) TaxID=1002809 RepID=F2F9W6_SOLSS|nr:glucosamine-6-phosphate deaminase [Solibacillus silvestris]OBW56874.1 glucosamine-6-phosphate deaminase [Solibacillus silvestris]BAK15086.1 6-phosphogluconolactonase/Glucosamine-6-phosphate isomerase/deaminase [Solibacillus silvestris StLB046]